MKAHVYSSIDAHPLLHALERAAKQLPDNFTRVEVQNHGTSTRFGQLALSGPVDGEVQSATLTQKNETMLLAALDNDSSLAPEISKRRLTAFLGPLLRHYNTTQKQNLAPDDQAIMIFNADAAGRFVPS